MYKYLFPLVLCLVVLCQSACSDDDQEDFAPVTEPVYATDDTHYRLPVVFHVFYSVLRDSTENIKADYLPKLLEAVNQRYAASGVDLNLEFVLAAEDPDGNPMEEPGVNRIRVKVATLSSSKFLKDSTYAHYMWNPDQYINISLFKEKDNAYLGISSFPYTLAPDTLPGLAQLPEPMESNMLNYPHCVCINTRYIYDYQEGRYSMSDVVNTLCHELGHYLGLRHVFGEDPETYSRDCNLDTDFCDDTPTYNKSRYDSRMLKYLSTHTTYYTEGYFTDEDIDTLVQRTHAQDGTTFISTNFMDYAVGYSNRFTPEQCERIRFVLMHSPFVPGPKVMRSQEKIVSRSADAGYVFPHRHSTPLTLPTNP